MEKIQKKIQHDIIVNQTWLLTMNVWENILHICMNMKEYESY